MKVHYFKILTVFFFITLPNYASAAVLTSYQCNFAKINIAFPNDDYAIMVKKNSAILLKNVNAASGARYVGDGFQIWLKDDREINLAKITAQEKQSGNVALDNGVICTKVEKNDTRKITHL